MILGYLLGTCWRFVLQTVENLMDYCCFVGHVGGIREDFLEDFCKILRGIFLDMILLHKIFLDRIFSIRYSIGAYGCFYLGFMHLQGSVKKNKGGMPETGPGTPMDNPSCFVCC